VNEGAGIPPDGTRVLRNHDHPPCPTPGQINNNEPVKHKGKRANITIATLNMRGSSAPTSNMNFLKKWTRINYMIRTNKIAILALQETHLDNELAESIKRCFGKNLDLLYSSNPNSPRTKAGVAFILNKALILNREPKIHVLAPGRAIMLKINWPDDNEIKIVNIYCTHLPKTINNPPSGPK
jgi:exonuclease III